MSVLHFFFDYDFTFLSFLRAYTQCGRTCQPYNHNKLFLWIIGIDRHISLYYSSTCHGRSLGWTATCFGRPLLRCTNYFAMLKYLHPTATCLTRPADSKMLDFIPAKAVNCHGSFQICGDYCDIFRSKVQHMCVFTCTHYTVDKCCWFVHTFSALFVSSLTVGLYSIVIDRCAS